MTEAAHNDWVLSPARQRVGRIEEFYDADIVRVHWIGPSMPGRSLSEDINVDQLEWIGNCTWRMKNEADLADAIEHLDWFANLREFHEKLNVTIGAVPAFRDVDLRWELIDEEVNRELKVAIEKRDMVETADAIVDSIYVLIGAAVTFGIDLRPIWNAVHAANLAKAGGPVRADGKRMKPEGWKPADVEGLLKEQGWKS